MATMTPKEIAADLGTDARTLRKFLRSDASGVEAVGKGSRYAIERKALKGLKAKFARWDAARRPAAEDGA